jgi:hypothetical protein
LDRRIVPSLLASLVAVGALLSPAPDGGAPAPVRLTCEPESGDRLVFAMSIADEAGTVLAEPMLVGMCGVPLEMTLAEPGHLEDPRMSLLLEPQPRDDGRLDIAFEVSVRGRVDAGRGRLQVRPGEERTAHVTYPGGRLEIQLAAFQVPSVELDLYLEHGRARRYGPGRT